MQVKRRAGTRFQRPQSSSSGPSRALPREALAALFLGLTPCYSTAATKGLRSAVPSTGPRLGVPLPSSCQSTPASSRSLPQSLVLKGSMPPLILSHCHCTPKAWTLQVTADSNIGPDVPKVHILCQPLGACFWFRKYGHWRTALRDDCHTAQAM